MSDVERGFWAGGSMTPTGLDRLEVSDQTFDILAGTSDVKEPRMVVVPSHKMDGRHVGHTMLVSDRQGNSALTKIMSIEQHPSDASNRLVWLKSSQ